MLFSLYLQNEVHDLRHNSSDATGSPYRMYGESYAAEGLQEAFPGAQTFHGVPLTGLFIDTFMPQTCVKSELFKCVFLTNI